MIVRITFRSLPHESWGTLMGVWFVYIRSWLLAPTLVVICATVEVAKSEKDLSRIELLHVALQV